MIFRNIQQMLIEKINSNWLYLYMYIYIIFCCRFKERKKYFEIDRSMKRFVFFFLGFIYLFRSYVRVCFQLAVFVREHTWYMALLMRYSMRLELTCVCSLNSFQLVMGLYGGHSSLFLRVCFTLVCFNPPWPLIFDTSFSFCVRVCVCWSGFVFHLQLFFLCVSWDFFTYVVVWFEIYW